ncbi:hypothetical protein ZWY2020_007644 [Hordeum vulgare]|nr:hypothetical protein ZWY2020_007644 [Hordeum vulgare]
MKINSHVSFLWGMDPKELTYPKNKEDRLNDHVLRDKLAKGMGHNFNGELAWPNDLLYIFLVVFLGTSACNASLTVLEPSVIGELVDPFVTPLEILVEYFFHSIFHCLFTCQPTGGVKLGWGTDCDVGSVGTPILSHKNPACNTSHHFAASRTVNSMAATLPWPGPFASFGSRI